MKTRIKDGRQKARYKLVLRSRARGFTLIEASISMLIMALLLVGTFNLFINAMRDSIDSSGLIFANEDASNALQTIVESTREAYYFSLPGETGFNPPSGTTTGSYTTTILNEGQTQTIYTGIEVTYPVQVGATAVAGLTQQPVNVECDSGPCTNPVPVYSRLIQDNGQTPSLNVQILYYRSDANGTPDANNGTCLWEYETGPTPGAINQPIIGGSNATNTPTFASIANISNAVQFVRPQTTGAQGQVSSIPYEVEIKIICSYYTPNGGASNEVSNGGTVTTSLDGKCVFLRDHEMGSTYESGATNQLGNQFSP